MELDNCQCPRCHGPVSVRSFYADKRIIATCAKCRTNSMSVCADEIQDFVTVDVPRLPYESAQDAAQRVWSSLAAKVDSLVLPIIPPQTQP